MSTQNSVVNYSATGTRTPVWNVRGSCDNHLHYGGPVMNVKNPYLYTVVISYVGPGDGVQ